MKTGTLVLLAVLGLGVYLVTRQKPTSPPPPPDNGEPWWEKLLSGVGDFLEHQNDGNGTGG